METCYWLRKFNYVDVIPAKAGMISKDGVNAIRLSGTIFAQQDNIRFQRHLI